MGVPGLSFAAGSEPIVEVPDSMAGAFDVAAALGNPSEPIVYQLLVDTGSLVGSPDTSTCCIDATGLHADSFGRWMIFGEVLGAGGDGGDGNTRLYLGPPLIDWDGGGGGGGAGSTPGAGGIGPSDATDGADGGTYIGGAAGSTGSYNPDESPTVSNGIAPTDGGDCILLNHAIEIYVSGRVGSGGGGGDGGVDFFTPAAQAGGDLGTSAGAGRSGDPGYAIRYSGSGNATITGAGAVDGPVG